MNREERRKAKKEGKAVVKDPTYTLTKSQLDKVIKDSVKEMRENVVKEVVGLTSEMFMVYCYVVLHDTFGFGKVRLHRFREKVDELADCVNGDYCSNQDLCDLVREEFGIELNDYVKELSNIAAEKSTP